MLLSERVEALKKPSNDVDVLIEIALFKPTIGWPSIRANNAGTKVIYTRSDGVEETFRAEDYTRRGVDRINVAAALRSRGL